MLEKKLILIVEDEEIIALDLADAVEKLHGKVIGPVGTVVQALELLEELPIDGALLDAHLIDCDVTPLARELKKQGIPFVIQTGTELPAALLSEPLCVPVLHKPQQPVVVVVCLINEMRDAGSQQLLD